MSRFSFALVGMGIFGAQVARADTKTECIAAADQAQQARDDGKYRAARDGFQSCSRSVCPKPVVASCTKWARDIAEAMPSVVLSAKDAAGSDLTDVRVSFDDAPLTSTLDGKPLDVDPGAHKLRFEREGSDPIEQNVVIKAGEKLRTISVVLRKSATISTAAPEHPAADTKSGSAAKTVTTAVLGVFAAGGLAGGLAMAFASQGDASSAATIRATMPTNACVGASGMTTSCQNLSNAVDAENRDGAISIAMYVTGGVLAAAALVAWFAWPKPKSEGGITARLIVGPAYGGIGGTF
jgi:hypothetical protein